MNMCLQIFNNDFEMQKIVLSMPNLCICSRKFKIFPPFFEGRYLIFFSGKAIHNRRLP